MGAVSPNGDEVREPAQHDESAELDDDPSKWKNVREADKIHELQRNGEVGQSD